MLSVLLCVHVVGSFALSRGIEMLFNSISTKFSLSHIHVRLTAKGLLRNLQLLSGCKRNTVVFCAVDKGKTTRPNARNQTQNQVNGHRGADPPPSSGPPLDSRAKNTKAQSCAEESRPTKTQLQLQGLKGLLHQSNLRCEGLSIVLQYCVAEREETLRKYADLSQELVNLREELANSSQTCERLALEKEEVAKMREQHRVDLAQLEERLQVFYAAEWEKTHQMYQEEADKCKAQMEDQLKTLQHQHEVLMNDLEASHSVKMESIKQQAEQSLAELCQTQEKQLETLNTTLHEIDNLTGQVEDLKADNLALNEKLKVAEELRKAMAAEAQDSHTLYLEQELESLKVVLDIKSKQLQQQDQKLMQMDKVLEKNEKLEKSLQMIQRENEDLKARMDRHVSLARQLSVDQMTMQENLEKESKENKRLSRENEELLWKLHNGDLNLTNRKSPPATPSSLPLQSP
ncbi:microtubule-associated tumor suppressor 1 homolog A isoform X2 [Engraulis encrasicolus]|uniref:microtubule-associated tumor suppressor 1 homolog A isoform X2 n=1 Tax=Engraulis encrasicolus TaxID=184585 RepID=UPI002FD69374